MKFLIPCNPERSSSARWRRASRLCRSSTPLRPAPRSPDALMRSSRASSSVACRCFNGSPAASMRSSRLATIDTTCAPVPFNSAGTPANAARRSVLSCERYPESVCCHRRLHACPGTGRRLSVPTS